jgi:hypothetical protein
VRCHLFFPTDNLFPPRQKTKKKTRGSRYHFFSTRRAEDGRYGLTALRIAYSTSTVVGFESTDLASIDPRKARTVAQTKRIERQKKAITLFCLQEELCFVIFKERIGFALRQLTCLASTLAFYLLLLYLSPIYLILIRKQRSTTHQPRPAKHTVLYLSSIIL